MKLLVGIIFLFSSLTASAFSVVVEKENTWSKKDIVVCWIEAKQELVDLRRDLEQIDPSLSDLSLLEELDFKFVGRETQQEIENTVKIQYKKEVVGIQYIGWKPCAQTPKFDVAIVPLLSITGFKKIKDEAERGYYRQKIHRGYRGRSGIGEQKDRVDFVLFNFMREDSIPSKTVYIHEFGHKSGLHHEHRIESLHDSYCEIMAGYPNRGKRIFITDHRLSTDSSGDIEFSSLHDPLSVMNYCYQFILDDYNYFRDYRAEVEPIEGDLAKIENEKNKKAGIPLPQRWTFEDYERFYKQALNTQPEFTKQFGEQVEKRKKLEPQLSKGDIHALKCLYVYNDSQKEKVCHKDFNPYQ